VFKIVKPFYKKKGCRLQCRNILVTREHQLSNSYNSAVRQFWISLVFTALTILSV